MEEKPRGKESKKTSLSNINKLMVEVGNAGSDHL